MAWTSKAILSLTELIVYANLTPVVIYTLYKHRLPSLLGHVFLLVFISLRVVADGLTIDHRNDPAGSHISDVIINSIGMSPLLLATAGFINESRHYLLDFTNNEKAKKLSLIMQLLLHVLVVGGVALLAVGGSNAATAKTTSDVNTYHAVAETGAILLLVAWLSICIWAIWTFRESSKQKKSGSHNCLARILMTEVLVSVPFTGVRVLYSVVYTFDHSRSLNPATSSFVVDFFLVFLPQLLAFSVLVLGLVVTRKINDPVKKGVQGSGRSTGGEESSLGKTG